MTIFKAYDIRGVYPTGLNEEIIYKIGQSYIKLLSPKGKICIGMDVRLSSPKLKESLVKAVANAGIDVLDLGLISTEMMYFATGTYDVDGGLIVTASHNPKEYNGLKMVKKNAKPIHQDNGIKEIEEMVKNFEEIKAEKKGEVEKKDILNDFCSYATRYIDLDKEKKLKIVYNPNFGFEGEVFKKFVEIAELNWEIIGLNDEPNGNFPKGRPDPFIPKNREEFIETVKETQADLGVAWDADADRVFFCANDGVFLEPYYTNALLIKSMLKDKPGETIIYEPRYTWAIIDMAKEMGATAHLERVGHSFIKDRMRKENAVFCGEASGHTYLRDFWYADSGLIPTILLTNLIVNEKKTLLDLANPLLSKYHISGERNFEIEDTQSVISEIEEKYKDADINKIDGLMAEYDNWRFSVRTSNTEPLLRLNLEAKSKELVDEKLKEIIEIIEK